MSKIKYKVLYFHNCPVLGGAGITLRNLIKEMSKNEILPIIACIEGPMADEFRKLNVKIEIINSERINRTLNPIHLAKYLIDFFKIIKKLLNIIKMHNIDCIHCNTIRSSFYGFFAAKIARISFVWHSHDILKERISNRLICKFLASGNGKIIAVSRAVKERLIKLGVRDLKIEVVYNGLDLRKWDCSKYDPNKIWNEFKLEKNVFLFSIVGLIAFAKGQHVFIESALRLLNKYNNIIFMIIGEGIFNDKSYELELRKHITNLCDNNIIFTGNRTDLPEIYLSSDVICVCSILPDSLPTVILEAMAMERPVIATNVGGIPEMVVDGETGFLIEPDNVDLLAEKMEYLLENKQLCKVFGGNARSIIENKFDIIFTTINILNIYNSLKEK